MSCIFPSAEKSQLLSSKAYGNDAETMFHAANILVFIGLKKLFRKKVIPRAQKTSKSAFNAKKKADLAEAASTIVRQSEEEEAEVGVAAFLCQLFLHSGKNHTGRMPEICDCMQNRISKTMLTMLTLLILKLSVEKYIFIHNRLQ